MDVDGRKIAEEVISSLRKDFALIGKIKMVAVAVGENPSVFSFLKIKQKIAKEIGVNLEVLCLSEVISQKDLQAEIARLAMDQDCRGIVLQMPLPPHFNVDEVIKTIPIDKDIDNLNNGDLIMSPAASTLKLLMAKYGVHPEGKNIVLNGMGRLVGKPIFNFFAASGFTCKIIEKETLPKEREKLIKEADILISSVGKANIVSARWIKKGAAVFDFGFDITKGRIIGDVEQKANKNCSVFTPMPGGTGPILASLIFQNLWELIS